MRRLLPLVLIAVLCLRAWAGEAMAGQMLAQQVAAVAVGQMQTAAPDAARHGPDCHDTAALQEGTADAHCASCVQCQDCSLNVLPAVVPDTTATLPHAPAASAAASFASAEPARGLKPPIA